MVSFTENPGEAQINFSQSNPISDNYRKSITCNHVPYYHKQVSAKGNLSNQKIYRTCKNKQGKTKHSLISRTPKRVCLYTLFFLLAIV